VPLLARDNLCTVYALDLLGLGGSAKPQGVPYSIELWAEVSTGYTTGEKAGGPCCSHCQPYPPPTSLSPSLVLLLHMPVLYCTELYVLLCCPSQLVDDFAAEVVAERRVVFVGNSIGSLITLAAAAGAASGTPPSPPPTRPPTLQCRSDSTVATAAVYSCCCCCYLLGADGSPRSLCSCC